MMRLRPYDKLYLRMVTYRLIPTEFAHDLSGTGSAKEPGRWNIKGTPALYTAATGH